MNWLTDLLNISSKKHRKDISGPDPRMSVVSTDSDDNFSKSSNEKGRSGNAKGDKSTEFADIVRNEKKIIISQGEGVNRYFTNLLSTKNIRFLRHGVEFF